MKDQPFSFVKRLKSFVYAWNGMKILFSEEHNSRIHLVSAILAILLGVYLKISLFEWIAISLAIGAVFAAELFNSALENLADHLAPEQHANIKKVKDLAAAAVLVSALMALAIGMIVFLPKIL